MGHAPLKGKTMPTVIHSGQGGRHYKANGQREVIEYMEMEAEQVFESTGSIKQALNAALAVKHERRAGTKQENSIQQELGKAANYRHRQKTGKWIP